MRKYQFGRNNLWSLNKRLFQKSLIQTAIVTTHPIRLFEPYCNKLIGCKRIGLWSMSVDGIRIARRHQYQSFEICEWHHYILHVAISIEYGMPVIPGIASNMHMEIQARWFHIRYRMNRRDICQTHIFRANFSSAWDVHQPSAHCDIHDWHQETYSQIQRNKSGPRFKNLYELSP